MQVVLSFNFPFARIRSPLAVVVWSSIFKSFFVWSNSHNSREHAKFLYGVVFFFIFFPFFVEPASASRLQQPMQIMNESIFGSLVNSEIVKDGKIKTDLFYLETPFNKIGKRFFEFRIFFVEFFSFCSDFVVSDGNPTRRRTIPIKALECSLMMEKMNWGKLMSRLVTPIFYLCLCFPS